MRQTCRGLSKVTACCVLTLCTIGVNPLKTKHICFILAPSDFHFFPHLKGDLKGTHFTSDDEVKQAVTSWIRQRSPEFFTDGMRKLVLCWEKCIERQGDYVEK
jgi:hypothetical protein